MSDASPTESRGTLDGLHTYFRGLTNLFAPRAVAIIGATDRKRSVGRTIVENLHKEDAPFVLYGVNPGRTECLGLPCYPSVEACPTSVDLALIVTPVSSVLSVINSCGRARVAVAIIITAGFKEIGPAGEALERKIVKRAAECRLRVIGPNCLGVMSPHWKLNASFAAADALPGNIAFVSQSGAMCTAVLDWSHEHRVGFSAFVSLGSMADIDWGELTTYFAQDPATQTLLLYMETVGRPQQLLSAARQVTPHKTIIAIKAGQTAPAAQAAISHTGSLAGSHAAFLAAMLRAGIRVVDTVGELCDAALFLGKQPQPQGSKLLLITNAGGPGVLATDAAALGGAELPPLTPHTRDALNAILPPAWSHGNPIDILGDAPAELYGKTLQIALTNPSSDGLLVILSPQSVTDSTGTARVLVSLYERYRESTPEHQRIPLFCSWMGGLHAREGAELLNAAGIPCFPYPDAAARTFARLAKSKAQLLARTESSDSVRETRDNVLSVQSCLTGAERNAIKNLFKKALEEKRSLLTEAEAKTVLRYYGIPVAETSMCCATAAEARAVAEQLNAYPLVAKIHSETLAHKSDVGGVVVNITSLQEVENAFYKIQDNVKNAVGLQHFGGITLQHMYNLAQGYELILGSHVDPQFGPLLLFGSGGKYVEILGDTVLALPPLTPQEAEHLVLRTRISKAMTGSEGQRFISLDMAPLCRIISLFSSMLVDLSAEGLIECDINPLLVTPTHVVALDARIVLSLPSDDAESQLSAANSVERHPASSVRPYPSEYCVQNLSVTPTSCCSLYVATSKDIPVLQRFFTHHALTITQRDCFDLSLLPDHWMPSLTLNDFTHTLCFMCSAPTSNEKSLHGGSSDFLAPVSLVAVLQRVHGTLDAARLIVYVNLNAFTPDTALIASVAQYILTVVVPKERVSLVSVLFPTPTGIKPLNLQELLRSVAPALRTHAASPPTFFFELDNY